MFYITFAKMFALQIHQSCTLHRFCNTTINQTERLNSKCNMWVLNITMEEWYFSSSSFSVSFSVSASVSSLSSLSSTTSSTGYSMHIHELHRWLFKLTVSNVDLFFVQFVYIILVAVFTLFWSLNLTVTGTEKMLTKRCEQPWLSYEWKIWKTRNLEYISYLNTMS